MTALMVACVLMPSAIGCAPHAADSQVPTKVLYYSPLVMDRVFANHQKPSRPGDYWPGMKRRADADCLTAVRYADRRWLGENRVIVVDLWDGLQGRWERHRCQAADHQMKRHATTYQRLEVDYATAKSVNMLRRGTTVARIVGYD